MAARGSHLSMHHTVSMFSVRCRLAHQLRVEGTAGRGDHSRSCPVKEALFQPEDLRVIKANIFELNHTHLEEHFGVSAFKKTNGYCFELANAGILRGSAFALRLPCRENPYTAIICTGIK
jgi:hypothetical protein